MESPSEQTETIDQPRGTVPAVPAAAAQKKFSLGDLVLPTLSGGVFGGIGAFIGNILGKYGDSETRKLARPFLTLEIGGLFGLIAFYSSWRAQQREQKPVAPIPPAMIEKPAATESNAPVENKVSIATPKANKPSAPQPMVSSSGLQYDGALAKNPEQQLA